MQPKTSEQHAIEVAARRTTPESVMAEMVALRKRGYSLRQIGGRLGRCMEGVRQALLRYDRALKPIPSPDSDEDEDEGQTFLRDSEPMRPGHPVAVNAIWRGLERWRAFDGAQENTL